MIKIYFTTLALMLMMALSLNAQTEGTLSVSFTQESHSGTWGAKHVLAVWIQDETGNFVKTKMRYWGSGTDDHLPIWEYNSNGNTVDATTGATLTSYTTRSFVWDGKDVNGSIVADGTYKVTLEECWSHGPSAKVSKSFLFTKGANSNVVTPADDTDFTNVSISWEPSNTAVVDKTNPDVKVFPNPSKGIFNIDIEALEKVTVWDLTGKLVYETNVNSIDISDKDNGIYYLVITVSGQKKIMKVVKI